MLKHLGFVVRLLSVLALIIFILYGPLQGKETDKEWTLPAIFEGEGAITIGCSFWGVPRVLPYAQDNPNQGFVLIQAGGDETNPINLLLLVDGPSGATAVQGDNCAISIDWRRFPTETRPWDREGD